MTKLDFPQASNNVDVQDKSVMLLSNEEFSVAEKEKLALALTWFTELDLLSSVAIDGRKAALLLKEIGSDFDTILAALLADQGLRRAHSEEEIKVRFGESVARLAMRIEWLNSFPGCQQEAPQTPEQAEHVRRMLLAMAEDVRAVLAQLAYRVECLRRLGSESYEIRHCYARETLDIYAPLANRLGVGRLKWLLEDLAFRYLEPLEYRQLAKALEQRRDERERYIQDFVHELQTLLENEGIRAQVCGRPKHLYSIMWKMRRKHMDLEDLYDLLAVRVVADEVSTCYAVLGIIHAYWTSIPKEFDDYIANPKENGYQSLHTAVIGYGGRPVEVQIRTREMHEFAEHGVAAHWRYKEGGGQDRTLDKIVNSLRGLLEHRNDGEDLLESFHTELFGDRVFVFTPKGKILDLSRGSTPLDFAYMIHTEVGHRCRGAKVNGRIVPLTYKLQSGEQVEILVMREAGPSRNWLNPNTGYLFSASARAKVRQWFLRQDRERNLMEGRDILDREIQRLGVGTPDIADLMRRFHAQTKEGLLLAIGRGNVRSGQLVSALRMASEPSKIQIISRRKPDTEKLAARGSIRVQGVDNLLVQFANCCRPVAGDPIIGYITKGKGVSIHRSDCPNILSLPKEQRRRLIEVDWGESRQKYPVSIHIEAFDRRGLLRDIAATFSNEKINVLAINMRTNAADQSVSMDLEVGIGGLEQLSRVLDHLTRLPHVIGASRKH